MFGPTLLLQMSAEVIRRLHTSSCRKNKQHLRIESGRVLLGCDSLWKFRLNVLRLTDRHFYFSIPSKLDLQTQIRACQTTTEQVAEQQSILNYHHLLIKSTYIYKIYPLLVKYNF
ncbi:hypothetical protein QVD17_02225 [Tagetes erecta]|uniref:Uncharacterized protein n=1 Tax=Tagetes erecta TaxID=13708 RepID=A0AAD8L677_TARER|nr:hypothetical protein QVD17_02225 [Tagetes erecta]